MQYIKNESHDPRYNLALEEYVLKNLEPEDRFIILWQNEPSVIIGRFQNTVEEINAEFINKHNINVVRRMTGGGAVYHDLGNLNFSFIERTACENIEFRKYNERLIKALAKLGVTAEHNSRNDITIEGRKFSGNAQYIYKGKVLHHGTILFAANLEDVHAALNVNPEKFSSKAVKSVRSRVTNIRDYLAKDISVREFKDILLNTLFDHQQLQEYQLSPDDLQNITGLMKEKYSSWAWNYGHSPAFNYHKAERFSCGKVDVRLEIEKGLIKDAKIFGDFFSSGDITELENCLVGQKYEKDILITELCEIDLSKFFGPLTLEEFMTCLF
ncbi:MAG: lipoate--protein ligase [Peptococcaceae bacterium]